MSDTFAEVHGYIDAVRQDVLGDVSASIERYIPRYVSGSNEMLEAFVWDAVGQELDGLKDTAKKYFIGELREHNRPDVSVDCLTDEAVQRFAGSQHGLVEEFPQNFANVLRSKVMNAPAVDLTGAVISDADQALIASVTDFDLLNDQQARALNGLVTKMRLSALQDVSARVDESLGIIHSASVANLPEGNKPNGFD